MGKQKQTDETAPPQSFEDALAELSQIVGDLEDGSIGLEQSLARFEQGMKLLRHCHQVLSAAEQRIEQLTGFDADGNELTAPFEATATIDDRRESAGRRRRSKLKVEVEEIEEVDDNGSDGSDVGPRLF
jgi:exodeoxyribonuclease VII small subunit